MWQNWFELIELWIEQVGDSVRSSNIILPVVLGMLALSAMAQEVPSPALPQNKRIVIAASTVLDG